MTPRPTSNGREQPRTGRAVSDLVGFILIFSLIVTVVAVISLAGMGSLESVKTAEQSNNAVRAMEVLADNMEDIHRRGAPSRATEISLEGASIRLGEEIEVVIDDPDSAELSQQTFGIKPIIYDNGEIELVYVMGAVFRDDQRGGTVVEGYEPVVDDGRVLIPVTNTGSASSGVQQLQSSTVLVRAATIERSTPVNDTDPAVTYGNLHLNVSSPRQELWHRTLSESEDLSCSQNDPDWVNCSIAGTHDRLFVTETWISVELSE